MDTLCSRGRTNVGGVDILRMKFPFQMRARDLFSSSFTPPPKRRSRACNLHDYTLGSRIGSLDKWTSTNISLSLSIEQFLSVQITIVIIMIPDFLSRALHARSHREYYYTSLNFIFSSLSVYITSRSQLFRSLIRICIVHC